MLRLALLGAVASPICVVADVHGTSVLVLEQMQRTVLAVALGAVLVLTFGMLRLA